MRAAIPLLLGSLSSLPLLMLLLPAADAFTLQSRTPTGPAQPAMPLKAAASAEDVAFAKRAAALMVPPPPPAAKAAAPSGANASPLFYLARFAMALAPSSLVLAGAGAITPALVAPVAAVHAAQASGDTEFKIEKGAASTLQSGIVKTITRGVNIENANFENKDLTTVSFQQSLVRDGNFRGAKLLSASFFDADLSNADFTGANMDQVNLELANMKGAILKNALVREAYVSGATRLTDVSIEGADFTGTFFRKDQQKYLCGRASGVNPTTKVSTKESLLCPE